MVLQQFLQKLEFMKQLLTETKEETSDDEELEMLEEKVRMYEFIVNFIHNPGEDVIYMTICFIKVYTTFEPYYFFKIKVFFKMFFNFFFSEMVVSAFA